MFEFATCACLEILFSVGIENHFGSCKLAAERIFWITLCRWRRLFGALLLLVFEFRWNSIDTISFPKKASILSASIALPKAKKMCFVYFGKRRKIW
jgi:hypothetical protein